MIFPTASDVLRCVDQALRDASDSDVPPMAVKSALATCRHLIRHAELRLRHEAGILRDDAVKTTALLETIAAYLDTGADHAMTEMATGIRATLSAPDTDAGGDDGMGALRTQVLTLREQVYTALACLQRLAPQTKAQKEYVEIRQRIRDYIADELVQEARLVQPAFASQGPRR